MDDQLRRDVRELESVSEDLVKESHKLQTQIEFLNTSQSYLMAKLLTSDEVEIVLDSVSTRLELQGIEPNTKLLFQYRDGITNIKAGIEKMKE